MRSGTSAHLWIVALAFSAAVSQPAAADDQQECLKGSKETAAATIAACTRAIESGDYGERGLSRLYSQRGYAWSWTTVADGVDRAFKDYTEAIRIDPKAADSLLNRSQVYNQRHDHDRAIADVNQAFESGLSHYGQQVGYRERGFAYQAKGDNDRAIADYTSSILLDANDKATLTARGNAYWAKRDFDRAIADYDQAIALDPKYALAYYNRATAYRVKGDLDRAIADSSQAIALYPRYRDAYFNRAYAYQAKGDLEHAIADYDRMIALDPKDKDAHSNRAKAYWSKGDFGRAIADSDPGQVLSWLAAAVFLAAAAWLCRRISRQARGRFSGQTMIEMCEQEVAEMRRRNAALERVAAALEKHSLG